MNKLTIKQGMKNEEVEYIRKKLFKYNLSVAPPNQDKAAQDLHLIVKDSDGNIFGGLIGKMYRSCLFIDVLWIDEVYRDIGYGSVFIEKAEEIAIKNKCKFIHLDTFSFQAPEFYKRNGYEVFGVLDGYPDGIKRYYLKKDL